MESLILEEDDHVLKNFSNKKLKIEKSPGKQVTGSKSVQHVIFVQLHNFYLFERLIVFFKN